MIFLKKPNGACGASCTSSASSPTCGTAAARFGVCYNVGNTCSHMFLIFIKLTYKVEYPAEITQIIFLNES